MLLNYLPPQIILLSFLPFTHASLFPHLNLIVVLLPTMFAFLAPSSSRLLIARSSLRDRAFLLLLLLRPHRLLLIAQPSFRRRAFLRFPPFLHRVRVLIAHLSFCRHAFLCPLALTSRAVRSAAARSSASCHSSVPIASFSSRVLCPTAMRSSSRRP